MKKYKNNGEYLKEIKKYDLALIEFNEYLNQIREQLEIKSK